MQHDMFTVPDSFVHLNCQILSGKAKNQFSFAEDGVQEYDY